MTTSHALIAFLVASSLLTITPGLDTMLVLRTAAIGGQKRAMAASLGICLGLLTWGICTSADWAHCSTLHGLPTTSCGFQDPVIWFFSAIG